MLKELGRQKMSGYKVYDWTGYSDKERLFCYEYLVDKNKAGAARRVGYAVNSAQQQSTRVYKKCE